MIFVVLSFTNRVSEMENEHDTSISTYWKNVDLVEDLVERLRDYCEENSLPIFNAPNAKGIMIDAIVGDEPQ